MMVTNTGSTREVSSARPQGGGGGQKYRQYKRGKLGGWGAGKERGLAVNKV